ncbi:MAG TPA: 16S rRNA (cytidine(1402)-2'-O)-methyltransferase [Blastocatellia bacterium]|nr:16S rRNA (cytidine(1402)-2'-O)-methyltransferase [Blastocatellia bacterium]
MAGTLFIVATPIGNLEDITLRALKVLGQVDVIACEDTRHTRKLLAHYQISKPLISYHEHNESERAEQLLKRLLAGESVALVSDAGTPSISDPGYRLIREAARRQIKVSPIPGPSAAIAALAGAGLPTDSFTFAGFLPSRRGARRARLSMLKRLDTTLVFYEAPHRIRTVLAELKEELGDRDCVVARELTKIHEEFIRGRLSEIQGLVQPRGEFVIILSPGALDLAEPRHEAQSSSILEAVETQTKAGMTRKEALKHVARARGLSKSEAYRLLIKEEAELE